jgi:cyclopropane fatty-acyl-phospholipid synthase-like methyltransferase
MVSKSNGNSLIESAVHSLDGRDTALYPYLPYLLQDFWEIGSSPEIMSGLIRKHRLSRRIKTALDLGCGKGAISIHLAKTFGWQVHGIDAMPAFIDEAGEKAVEFGVEDLCRFELGDIREKIHSLPQYDLIVLGSIGPVLGNISETLQRIKSHIAPGGYCLPDDGYALNQEAADRLGYPTRDRAHQAIRDNGYTIVDENVFSRKDIIESDEKMLRQIEARAAELIAKHPDKRALFEGYIQAQREEGAILEDDLVCVTWLLKLSP